MRPSGLLERGGRAPELAERAAAVFQPVTSSSPSPSLSPLACSRTVLTSSPRPSADIDLALPAVWRGALPSAERLAPLRGAVAGHCTRSPVLRLLSHRRPPPLTVSTHSSGAGPWVDVRRENVRGFTRFGGVPPAPSATKSSPLRIWPVPRGSHRAQHTAASRASTPQSCSPAATLVEGRLGRERWLAAPPHRPQAARTDW